MPARRNSGGPPQLSLPGPLADLVDLLARRHSLAAFWELRTAAMPYKTLVQRLAAPENQLSQRLRELRESGLIEVNEAGDYRLTSEGRRLLDLIEQLAQYADEWAQLTPRQRVPRGAARSGRGEHSS